ncbi:MAG: hypothetical protein U5N56_01930 [Candidatus Marinimicrobia bacterium]|nr:hypothetical protein [Candidatus Neomarinimicrobiota bacterium]
MYSPEDRIQTGDAQITRSTFVQNTAISGSALFFDKRESVYVDSCVFWQNTNASGSLNTFSLDHRARSASVLTNTASDDNNINGTVSGLIHYRSTEKNGPFRDTENYLLDNQHGIPEDYGWYYVPSPLF